MGIEQLTVDYVRHSGDDLSVVNAARVSFESESEALGYTGIDDKPMVPVIHDRDRKLIKYLADHEHFSPFNHAFVTFRCTAPLFVMGQLKKHEYMPWNEISRRYVDTDPEFYVPDEWRGKSEDKKQGSEGVIENINISAALMIAEGMYKSLLDRNVCEEQARMVLPQAMLSSWVWSGSIKAVSKMCKLRCASDTQYESRVVANKISDIMKELYPVSWDALMHQDSGTVGK
jgi:thymidylate synthase (FAD)